MQVLFPPGCTVTLYKTESKEAIQSQQVTQNLYPNDWQEKVPQQIIISDKLSATQRGKVQGDKTSLKTSDQ